MPMNELIIGNFHIDISRSQVRREKDVITLEPKVLKVLIFLASRQGEVITHQSLLEEVWPNSVVDQSSLQRCIAQLRKAFHDTAKQQKVIATYPKKGYSLLLPVTSGSATGTKPDHNSRYIVSITNLSKHVSKYLIANRTKALMTLSISVCCLFLYYLLTGSQHTIKSSPSAIEPPNDIVEKFSSTAPNQTQFYAVYSPDDQFVVYPRFTEDRLGHLWAQDLLSDETYQLTSRSGFYEYAAWSPDSQRIAIVDSTCSAQDNCQFATCAALSLLTLGNDRTFNTSAGQLQSLVDCSSKQVQSPVWLSPNEIVFIETSGARTTIVKYLIDSSKREVLYQHPGKTPYHLSYSSKLQKLAITLANEHSEHELLILAIDTDDIEEISLDLPNYNHLEPWYPSWDPHTDTLVISSLSGKIFNITLDGTVTERIYPFLP